jgi:MbtH protein
MTADLHHSVVVNDEEQYSIWPSHREPPAGWRRVGEPATREDCLAYIERHWTDITPRSVREGRNSRE